MNMGHCITSSMIVEFANQMNEDMLTEILPMFESQILSGVDKAVEIAVSIDANNEINMRP